MPAAVTPRHALVLGGSGAVGSAVVQALAARGVQVDWTWHRNALAPDALPGHGHRVDLRDPAALRALLAALAQAGRTPTILVHAALAYHGATLGELDDTAFDEAQAVNVRAPYVGVQALAPHWAATGGADVVLLGALDRTQALPMPPHFAATQGALSAMAMALAKELGPDGVRVNLVASGPLTAGLARRLPQAAVDDYLRYSALRRLGTPDEVARVVAWLALENRYINGKSVSVNGGIA